VWLFRDFDNAKMGQVPQLLSDHPSNQTRVAALKRHFQKEPAVFGNFSPDSKSASPFVVPKNAEEVFMR
jgi:hypothetical protein